MKLLLTSSGIDNDKIGKEFLKLVDKPASEIKILFVPTASRTEEELYYVAESKKELLDLGIKKKDIVDYNLGNELEGLDDFDVMYVCGGNTFYLLHRIRESGFDKVIKEFVESGKVYVGVSAGSMVMGPDIDVSGIKVDWDKNDVCLKDLTGLNFTDKRISPHYTIEDEEIIKKFEEKTGKEVTRLKDSQALLIIGEEVKVLE